MGFTQQEQELTIDNLTFIAECYGWQVVAIDPKKNAIKFKREGMRLVFHYVRGIVLTQLDHPKQGLTRLVRKQITEEHIEDILDNPRVHNMPSSALLKSERQWRKFDI